MRSQTGITHRFLMKNFSVVFLATLLASCGGGTPPQTYDLSALQGNATRNSSQKNSLRGQIIVYEPSAIAVYDSERIVVRGASQGLTYLAASQWADRLPKLVQARIIQSFENSGRYQSVGRPGDHISASSLLTTEIRAFEVDEQNREAIVQISVKRVGQGSGRIEIGQLFTGRAPVSTIDGAGASAALDEALRNVLNQIVGWSGR